MKRVIRIIPFLVCLVFIVGVAASCGNKTGENDASNASSEKNAVASSGADGSALADDNSGTNSDSKDNSSSKASIDSSDSKDDQVTNNSGSDNADSTVSDLLVQIFEMSSGVKVDKNSIGTSNNSGGNKGNDSSSSSGSNAESNNGTGGDKDNSNANTGNNGGSDNSGSSGNKGDVTLAGDEKSFVITVYPDEAPITCENFDKLVNDGFYNGLQFYRVIRNFIAETGDPNNDGTGGSSGNIKGEFMQNGVNNKLSHTKGTVSMDRKPSDMNSANSRFFVCYDDNCKFMDGQYAAFGKVTSGMDVIEDFLTIERDYADDGTQSVPVKPITIKLAEPTGKDSDGNPQYKFYVTY